MFNAPTVKTLSRRNQMICFVWTEAQRDPEHRVCVAVERNYRTALGRHCSCERSRERGLARTAFSGNGDLHRLPNRACRNLNPSHCPNSCSASHRMHHKLSLNRRRMLFSSTDWLN